MPDGSVSAVPKHLVQALLGTLGLRLTRLQKTELSGSLSGFFFLLKERGFAPKHIVDVGANRGLWTRAALRYFPDAYYTLVEPQDHLRTHVQDLLALDGRIRWIGAGAGEKVGTLPFVIRPDDDVASTFILPSEEAKTERTSQIEKTERQIEIPIITLDEIVRTSNAPFPDLVKIDAEGLDLKVLTGASELIGKTDIFLLEAAVYPNGWENTLGNVIQTMDRLGYRMFDIHDLNYGPKGGRLLLLCETAFLRNASHLLDGPAY
jgi:FkbM family methyltransferase